MIPLRDHNRPRTFPFITYGLIAANVLVFLLQLSRSGEDGELGLVRELGLRPVFVVAYLRGEKVVQFEEPRIVRNRWGDVEVVSERRSSPVNFPNAILPFLTMMFLHGGWLHILSNMWFLHIFGDNVEDRLRHFRYLLFYLATGLVASIAQVVVAPDSPIPCVGASGAISGVLGGYALVFPTARVLTLVPIFIFIQFVEIPAFVFLFIWFGIQVLSGIAGEQSGVAWWAHIGGFVAGLGLVKVFGSTVPPREARRIHYQ